MTTHSGALVPTLSRSRKGRNHRCRAATFSASDSTGIWTYVSGYLALMLDQDACD
jgi:hypothetical protein